MMVTQNTMRSCEVKFAISSLSGPIFFYKYSTFRSVLNKQGGRSFVRIVLWETIFLSNYGIIVMDDKWDGVKFQLIYKLSL